MLDLLRSEQMDLSSTIYSLGIISQFIGTQNTVPLGVANLFLIVPCGQELNFQQVFQIILPAKGYYFLIIYLVFALFESLATSFNNYLRGHGYNFSIGRFLLNLKVIAGFLGQASPMGNVNCLFLRQILIVLAFYGVFQSSWFNASLSTLLTKHPQYQHIRTYKELADSQLPVAFDWGNKLFIETQYDKEFFQKKIPNAVFMPMKQQVELVLSLNTSICVILRSCVCVCVPCHAVPCRAVPCVILCARVLKMS